MAEQQTEAEERCPKCHMRRIEWQNNGQGYGRDGVTYCCRGCAEGTGCTCHQTLA